MLDKALKGSRSYWALLIVLSGFAVTGAVFYYQQFTQGLGVTGMSRDISWGYYIAQFTFLVGVAASAVMLVIPYYLHDYKKFGKLVILGEFLAVSAVIMCMLFIMADMGQPMRFMNIILHPTPGSVMFWDFLVLAGYLALNIVIGWTTLGAEHKRVPPPAWVKPLIYLSVPWAVSIHTVTAFLYAGLPGRHFWLTAIMAARFLSSAFAAGPALLIILSLIVRNVSRFEVGKEPIQTLGKIVTYAMIANIFFFLLEVFTAFYSGIPSHQHTIEYLFNGIGSHNKLVPWMWTAAVLGIGSLFLLVNPKLRRNENILVVACITVFVSTWIDKGMGLVIGGFIPNMFERVTEYTITVPEFFITIGIWAIGFLVLTVLYKVAISVREEVAGTSN